MDTHTLIAINLIINLPIFYTVKKIFFIYLYIVLYDPGVYYVIC